MIEKILKNKSRFFLPGMIVGVLCLTILPQLAISDLIDESFSRLPLSSGNETGYALAVGDVNNDGAKDAVMTTQSGVSLLLNNGSGGFQVAPEGTLPTNIASQVLLSVELKDLDGDNDLDMLLANGGGNNFLLINNAGQFVDQTASRLPADSAMSVALVAEDIDSDGDLDVILANRKGVNNLYVNNGSGVFSDETAIKLGSANFPSTGLLLFDADNNGSKDLLVLNEKSLQFYSNNGLGAFTDNSSTHLPVAQFGAIAAKTIDADNDGDLDLVVAAADAGVKLLINNGSGQFSDESASLLPVNSDFAIKVGVEDIDFDGLPDIFVANAGQDRVLLNEGNGHFTQSSLLAADNIRSFAVGLFDIEDDFDIDALLTTSKGSPRLLNNNISVPRLRILVSPDYIEVGNTVNVAVESFDEDGVASETLTVIAPDSTTQALSLNLGNATYVPTQQGEHIAVYSATDNLSNSNSRQRRFNVLAADTTAPTLSIDITKSDPLLLGHSVDLKVTASDDRAVADISMHINGQSVPLDSSGQASYITSAAGVHTVTVIAHDAAGNEGTETAQFTVASDTQLPVASLTLSAASVNVAENIDFQTTASDNVLVINRGLTVTGPGITGSQELVLDSSGNAQSTFFLPGLFAATFQATDPSGNVAVDTKSFEVVGVADSEAPVVDIQIVPQSVAIGGDITLEVIASDNIAVNEKRLEINGTPVILDVDGKATYTPPAIGEYTVTAYAVDFSLNEGSASKTFKVVDPASDVTTPDVSITSPIDDQEISGKFQITGTATDETFVSYSLSYAPVGSSSFTEFVSGNQEVINGDLGTFDASMLENGFYQIQLSATDVNGRTSFTSVVVSVAGELKLGQFTVSFQDKNLNIGMLPLTVTRSYDSRNRSTVGDFGHGWEVSFNDVKVTQNRIIGVSWTTQNQGGFIPQVALVPVRPHTVSVKFGENEEFKFAAKPSPEFQAFGYQYIDGFNFEPIGDTKGTLVPSGSAPFLYSGGQVMDFNLNIYNPSGYVYTSEDGYIYRFSTGGGNFALNFNLTSVTDPNGVTVNITPNGFQRSDGLSVTFVRDTQGRITRLTDPEGNNINYEYDAVTGDLAAVIDAELNRTEFVYDANHFLTEIKDPLGRPAQRQEYDDDGRLVAITDATGKRIEMEYDLDANTQIVRDRRGNPTIYEYDSRGNVTKQTEFPTVNGSVQAVETIRTYDADSQMISEILPNGMETTFTYSTKGYLLSRVIDAGGLQISEEFTYDSSGRVLTNTDARGNTTNNFYDAQGRLISMTDRDGKLTSYEYDSNGNRTRITDPTGEYTVFEYDAFGNRDSEERFDTNDNSLQRKEFTYDNNGNVLSESIIVERNNVPTAITTLFEYNKNGFLIGETDPLDNKKSIVYDSVGNKTEEIDKQGHSTKLSYDSTGNVIKTEYPDGSVLEYTYDDSGNRTSIKDRNLRLTTFEYDALDRLTRTVFADNNTRQKLYDVVGNVIAEIDELGHRTDHQYDAVGRRIKTIQPLVFDGVQGADVRPETSYEYDKNGNKTRVVDANGNATTHQYDAMDRMVETRFSDTTTELFEYDGLGRMTKKTDPSGLSTLNEYDALGNLIKVTLPDPDGSGSAPVTTYQYNKLGKMIAQTDANAHVTKFEYDDVGNKLSRELPGGQKELFAHDAEGRVIEHTDFNGELIKFTYDEVGRVINVLYPDSSTVQTTYSGDGQRLTETDARGLTTYVYDVRNRLQQVTFPNSRIVQYSYDAAGNQASVTSAGTTTSYTYDALQRLSTTTDKNSDVTDNTYDAVGNLVRVDYANGANAVYSYNSRNQLTSLVNSRSDTSVISSYAYSLNSNGLRTRVEEADGSVVDYVYDDNYRLVSEVRTGTGAYSYSYSYDLVGNRLEAVRDGVSEAYTYDDNDRMLTAGSKTYQYDANGNQTQKTDSGTTSYEYDYANRLIQSIAPNGDTTSYEYDAEGNRVAKLDGSGTTEYVLDLRSNTGHTQVIEERDGTGNLSVSYTYAHDLISQDRSGVQTFYHYDGAGSTRVLTSLNELVTDSYLYDAYGRALAISGTTQNVYRFSGERLDPNVGLYYLRARYYDQNAGRFMTMDPHLGDPQSPASLHRYLYANNNPVNFTDPTGRFTMISISISISINTSIRSIYTQNLVKFFFKALKIIYCTLEPAYELQALGLQMISNNVPGGF